MYDRAPRVLRLAEGGSTEDRVGPGSYQVPYLKQQATGGYAPFLSLTARESTFTVISNTEKDVPGPGHYNVSEKQCNIKGGQSLQNREKRFKKFISDGPGPASYDRSYPGTLAVVNRKTLEAKKHLQSKMSRALKVFRSVYVPSIPFGRSYGYDINEDDSIIKHLPPASDSTLGPAYYKPKIAPHYENVNIKKDQQQNSGSNLRQLYEVKILQEEKEVIKFMGIELFITFLYSSNVYGAYSYVSSFISNINLTPLPLCFFFFSLNTLFHPTLFLLAKFLWRRFFLYLILYFEDDMPRYSVFNSYPCFGDTGIEPTSPVWQTDSLPLSHLESSVLPLHIYKTFGGVSQCLD
ncbi:hypothetical protein FD754_018590, partial [Muntiacus muntjak]